MNPSNALTQYRKSLKLSQINFAQYAELTLDRLDKMETSARNINPETLQSIQETVKLNLQRHQQIIKAHQLPNLNLISDQVFQHIELDYHQILNPKLNHDNRLINEFNSIIRNDPKIYYPSFKRESVPLPWPQADQWKALSHQYGLNTHHSQSIQLKYGPHGSKKFGDIISIPYQKPISPTTFQQFETTLSQFLNSHRRKNIRNLNIQCYLDPKINRFLIFILNPNLTKE